MRVEGPEGLGEGVAEVVFERVDGSLRPRLESTNVSLQGLEDVIARPCTPAGHILLFLSGRSGYDEDQVAGLLATGWGEAREAEGKNTCPLAGHVVEVDYRVRVEDYHLSLTAEYKVDEVSYDVEATTITLEAPEAGAIEKMARAAGSLLLPLAVGVAIALAVSRVEEAGKQV